MAAVLPGTVGSLKKLQSAAFSQVPLHASLSLARVGRVGSLAVHTLGLRLVPVQLTRLPSTGWHSSLSSHGWPCAILPRKISSQAGESSLLFRPHVRLNDSKHSPAACAS